MQQYTTTIHFRLTQVLLLLMPMLQKALPILIGLLALNCIIAQFGKEKARPKQWLFIGLMFAYYLWHAIGLLWSTNTGAGTFDLEVKLSFMLLPLLYGFSHGFTAKQWKQLLVTYLLGVALINLALLGHSSYLYFTESAHAFQFYGKYYCKIMHIGYFAMHTNLAICVLFFLMVRHWKSFSKTLRTIAVLGLIWGCIIVVQTSSKNGILTLFLLLPVMGMYLVVTRKKYLLGLLGIVGVVGVFAAIVLLSPRTLFRFQEMWANMQEEQYDPSSDSSTALRSFVWESSTDLINEAPLIGHGTGDVKDELLANYAEKGYTAALEKKINSHSQFLQTGVALGWIGLILLIALFLTLIWISIKHKNRLLFLFTVIMVLYATTESVFEVQAGVVFFAVWSSILVLSNSSALRKSSQ